MNSIYACKLYKSSTRKNKIQAALQDPMNAELVQQLAGYLDEEYQVPVVDEKKTKEIKNPKDKSSSSGSHKSSPSSSSGGHTIPHAPSSGGPSLHDEYEDLVGDGPEVDEGGELDENHAEVDNPTVEESTNLEGKSVTASTTVTLESLASAVNEIKGTLNAKDDTSGVSRVRIKDEELWIYYNDNINLNNVMTPVVELLEATGFYYLEFNRLARSENAAVFQVNVADTKDNTQVSENE